MAVGTKRKRARRVRPRHASPVTEIIGREARPGMTSKLYRSRTTVTSVDATVPDYAFYDLLRRGKQIGYKLGALFAKRIEHIFAVWVLGRGLTVKLVESGAPDDESDPRNITDARLVDFLAAHHALLMTIEEDKIGLGDQYIVVNADGTLSVPSPDTVEVERDPLDYRVILGVKITTRLPDATIVDAYRADGRTVTVTQMIDGKQVADVQEYDNLIGRIPVIHLAHGRSGNETNGHSIHEDLLKLYDQYDDVVHKQLDGAKLLGNPILAFTGLEDLSAVIDANKPTTATTYSDQDGNEVTRPELNVDANSVMLIGKGGDGKFIAPPTGFTADTQQALKTLFLLLLDRTGIPEFIWGNEMSSARASSDTQMIQWAHDVEGWQRADEEWLLALCEIWLATVALTDPQVVVEALTVEWPPVLDESQELKLKSIELARSFNLLTDKTTLELLQLVEDAGREVEGAQGEAQTRQKAQQAQMQAQAATLPPREVTQMHGYDQATTETIVAGAIRQLAGA